MQDIAFQLCLIKGVYKSQYHEFMFRNLAKLVARGAHRPLTTSTAPFIRTKQNVFFFSSIGRHPTIERIQCGVNTTNLGSILSDVQALGEEDQTTALRMIITKVQRQQIPVEALLHQKFVALSQKYPGVFIEGRLQLIDKLSKQVDVLKLDQQTNLYKIMGLLQVVNKSYQMCYDQTQKMKEIEKSRYKLLLDKRYSDFYVIFLVKHVNPNQRQRDLNRCAEVYTKEIQTFKIMLKEKEKAIRETTYDKTIIKGNTLTIIDLYGQSVIYLKQIAKEIYNTNHDKESFKKRCSETVQNIKDVLQQYKLVQELIHHSGNYNQLKKIKLTAEYYLGHQKLIQTNASDEEKEKFKQGMAIQLRTLHDENMTRYEQMLVDETDKYKVQRNARSLLMVKSEQFEIEKVSLQKFRVGLQQELQVITSKIADKDIRQMVAQRLKACLEYIMRCKQSITGHSPPLEDLL